MSVSGKSFRRDMETYRSSADRKVEIHNYIIESTPQLVQPQQNQLQRRQAHTPSSPRRQGIFTSASSHSETQISESSSAQTQQTGTSCRLLIHEGIAHHERGNYDKALKCFQAALKSQILDVNAGDHPLVAHTMAMIGSVYLRQGRQFLATESLTEALEMMQRLRKHCHTQEDQRKLPLVGILNNLGTVASLQGDLNASLDFHQAAIQDALLLGGFCKDVANALHNIGRILMLQQDWETALSILTESLQVEEELYGRDNLSVVDTLNLLGFVQFSLKALGEALVTFAEALSIVRENNGLIHEQVAISLMNVGMVMERQGRLRDACKSFDTALDVLQQVGWSEQHPTVRTLTKTIERIGQAPRRRPKSEVEAEEVPEDEVEEDVVPAEEPLKRDSAEDQQGERQADDARECDYDNVENCLGSARGSNEYIEYREELGWEQENSICDSRDEENSVGSVE